MISIIVPARDEAGVIGRCLTALRAQTGLAEDAEIIVVDDASLDRTAAIAREASGPGPPVRILSGRGLGAGAARNVGAVAARGDVLLFIDADCRATPSWAVNLTRAARRAGVDAAMGLQHTDQRDLVARIVQAELDEKHDELLRRERITFADTSTVAFRAAAFRAVGGFDERLRHFEDTDLAFRLAAAGRRMVVAGDAVVLHEHPVGVGAYAVRKFRIARWGAPVYARFPHRVTDDSRTPASMRLQLGATCLLLLGLVAAPWWAPAGAVVAASAGVFAAACVPFLPYARRHGTDAALAAPALLLLRSMSILAGAMWGIGAMLASRRAAVSSEDGSGR